MTNNANPSPNQLYHQCADIILTPSADPPADAGVVDAGIDMNDAGNANSDAGNGSIDENELGMEMFPLIQTQTQMQAMSHPIQMQVTAIMQMQVTALVVDFLAKTVNRHGVSHLC